MLYVISVNMMDCPSHRKCERPLMRSLLYAVGPLLFDSLGVILFALLLALGVDAAIATLAAAAVACGVVLVEKRRGHPIAALQWISLGLVLISGGATLMTGNPLFMMVKPSVIYVIIGAAMLRRGWLNRYVAPDDLALVGDVMERWGYVWAAMMFGTAAANLAMAYGWPALWPMFIGLFPLVSKLALFAVHFTAVQLIGRRRRALAYPAAPAE